MRDLKFIKLFLLAACLVSLLSCNKQFKDDNYTAYFGGEVTNPTNPYVLFCRGSEVIDTIRLKKDNTFFIKFDSLTPGLYNFKNEPEFQYVYFDKNDSIMVRINADDFDESIVFCGRGEEKNNFLMELYLKNEEDKKKIYDVFDYEYPKFKKNVDSTYAIKKAFYDTKKQELEWSDDFDIYAQACLNFNHYIKKKSIRLCTKHGQALILKRQLPVDFYDYRHDIDFNNLKLKEYSPFVKYLTYMLNNVALSKDLPANTSPADMALDMNIRKMNIADTLFKNEKIKNTILNNIAFTYLLEDQNIVNNKKFLDKYHVLSTDTSQHNEILKIGNAIQQLKTGNKLPEVALVDMKNEPVSIDTFIKSKTVLFFWTESLESHLAAAHKKIIEMQKSHPDYHFIGICVDNNQKNWLKLLSNYKFDGVTELRAADFEDMKEKWVINKIHRTMILNADGTIENAFVNLFDVKFEDNLK
ncbi:peroxiredoxin family protein [Flavobacterium sp. 3HN19-14]|uniref:peroxiredoxin family protein n=1 Tax=Flavobacterium sp. 3HN19-14 TaxID=3448133 RepID=UPI003EE17FA4